MLKAAALLNLFLLSLWRCICYLHFLTPQKKCTDSFHSPFAIPKSYFFKSSYPPKPPLLPASTINPRFCNVWKLLYCLNIDPMSAAQIQMCRWCRHLKFTMLRWSCAKHPFAQSEGLSGWRSSSRPALVSLTTDICYLPKTQQCKGCRLRNTAWRMLPATRSRSNHRSTWRSFEDAGSRASFKKTHHFNQSMVS